MKNTFHILAGLLLACSSALGLAAGEVRLLKAESVVDTHYGLNSQSPRFEVLLQDLNFVKKVYIHLKRHDGRWIDVPLSYNRDAHVESGQKYEVWSGTYFNLSEQNGSVLPAFDPEFAIKYVVNGQEYWDNNGGTNYRLGQDSGTALLFANVYDGYFRPNAFSNGGQYSSWVTVKNIAFEKTVEVVYSTDNWSTPAKVAVATFSDRFWMFAPNGVRSNARNPGQNGFEEWNYSLNTGSAQRVDYAIKYTVKVASNPDRYEVYWDNNFGRNYRVNLTVQ